MKTIKLNLLKLYNFKGIKEFVLDLHGGDAKVFGDNATGKTTLYDSFLWLLFGKDSNNRADFSIKTLDEQGNELHNLDHEVEAQFDIDGQALTLRKVYKEKYTKQRGQATASFTGHETDYYIDGVPSKKKEYEEKIKSLVDEDVFKLITSPTYFNESIKWQDRRKTLLEICGDVGLKDVIRSNPALKELPVILQNRTIEEHQAVIKAKKSEINKELELIPARIDELYKSTPEKIDVEPIRNEVTAIEQQLDEKAEQINNIKNGTAIATKENQLKEIELQLKEIQNELESELTNKGYQVQAKIQEEEGNIAILNRQKDEKQRQIDEKEHRIKLKQADIESLESKLSTLREEYTELNKSEYKHTHDGDDVCPTCNQDLPVDQVEAARNKAVEEFNVRKSEKLTSINQRGKDMAAEKMAAQTEIGNLQAEIEVLQKDVTGLDSEIAKKILSVEKLNAELDGLRKQIQNARQDERYTSKLVEQEKAIHELESLKTNAQESILSIQDEIDELRIERNKLNGEIAKQSVIEANEKRIKELEAQQKELATEFEQLGKELYLTEQFIISKVELLEERINSKFKFARFKLFESQINGGLKEVCETTVGGVPYSSGLNNAAKINVGLDVINTLTAHYGIQAPIFVDNAEAVTQLIDTDSQLISLVVSEKDKELRIETEATEQSEVA